MTMIPVNAEVLIYPSRKARTAARNLVAHCLRQAREAVRLEDFGAACRELNDGDLYAEYLTLSDANRYQAAAETIQRRMVKAFDRKAVRHG